MSGLHDFLAEFDRICGTFSAALQNAEFHNYLTLLMIALLCWSLIGTRNDLAPLGLAQASLNDLPARFFSELATTTELEREFKRLRFQQRRYAERGSSKQATIKMLLGDWYVD